MLILTRRNQEEILIGDDVVVKIIGIEGGIVRVGISADKTINIVREEIEEIERVQEVYTNAGHNFDVRG